MTGEPEGFVEGDPALHMVAEEDPLVRLLVDGGLRQDAQGSVGPGDDADVVGVLAVGVVEKLKETGLLVQVYLLGGFVACGLILADVFLAPASDIPSVPSATAGLGGRTETTEGRVGSGTGPPSPRCLIRAGSGPILGLLVTEEDTCRGSTG